MFKDRLLRRRAELEEEKEDFEKGKEKGKKIFGKDRLAAQKRAQKGGVQPARAPLAANTHCQQHFRPWRCRSRLFQNLGGGG